MVQGTVSSAGLPPGWQEVHAEGKVYYWDTRTNETTFTRPTAESKGEAKFGYLGHSGASFSHLGADDAYGAEEYNAPPPDAYAKGKGLGTKDLGYGATETGAEFRKRNEISVRAPPGVTVPDPMVSFDAGPWPAPLMGAVKRAGYENPTAIQAQSWPIALQGYDMISVAKTGSGKTVAFLFPGLMHIAERGNGRNARGPMMLALAPTRELATQIQEECNKFGQSVGVFSVCLYGGAPKGRQLHQLRNRPQICIATPGRLNDLLESRHVDMSSATYVVLDEADRMLDMGFEPQIRKILSHVPVDRQTLFFTATWPKAVIRVATAILTNPIQVNIGETDQLVANKDITQSVEICAGFEKEKRLMDILNNPPEGCDPLKALVFCSTKRMCDQIGRSIGNLAGIIHGDKEQRERDWILNSFRTGRTPVLVATDVAARGLDIKDCNLVVNYDFPNQIEDYVHRIGRTGRAGKKGWAFSFIDGGEGNMARKLVPILRDANQVVPPEIEEMARSAGMGRGRNGRGGRGGRGRGGGGYRGGGGGYGGGGYGGGGGGYGGGGYGGGGGGGGYGGGGGGYGGGGGGYGGGGPQRERGGYSSYGGGGGGGGWTGGGGGYGGGGRPY